VARSERPSPAFSPHFVILPSKETCTFLVKSIAPRELVLPVDLSSPDEPPVSDAVRKMESSLSLVRHCDCHSASNGL